MPTRTVHFLLIDDDDYDVMAVQRAFKILRILNPLHIARDGIDALEQLRATGDDRLPRPLVLLVDLNMPRMNGLEMIREVRADPDLRDLSIFVLTTSDGELDRRQAAENRVSGYVVKSDDTCLDVAEVIETLSDYWRLIEAPAVRK